MNKKILSIASALVCGLVVLSSCSTMMSSSSSSSASSSSTSSSSSSTAGTAITSILGAILGSTTTTQNTIVGSWTYSQPAVAFESESLLAEAGGSVVSAQVVSSLEPYYKKVGITADKVALTLNEDKSCVIKLNGKSYDGTYTFDSSAGTLTLSTTLLSAPKAYVTVVGSQMSLTFDASKILTLFQGISALSGSSSTLSSISTIASQYDGMKIGFQFTK